MPPPPTDPWCTYNVLLTGFGPFSRISDNPSWECTKALHNTTISTPSGCRINVTCIGPIRVSYTSVLKLTPLIHSRPPRLPTTEEAEQILDPSDPISNLGKISNPPVDGYDLVLHVGAGRNGVVSLEQIGHKTGYNEQDVIGEYAPIVGESSILHTNDMSEAETFENVRLGHVQQQSQQLRGFGEGFEGFPDELQTEVDIGGIIQKLKTQGENRVIPSTNAGRYLCDFICYASLAESQRSIFDSRIYITKRTKTLFMHVPSDEDSPFTKEELVELVRQIVISCIGERAL